MCAKNVCPSHISLCKNNVNANNVCTTGELLAEKIKHTHDTWTYPQTSQVVTATRMSPLSPLYTLPLTKEQDAAVWIYSGKILEPLQASRHAVIRDRELMENQSAEVEWPGEERRLVFCMASFCNNLQPPVCLSLIHTSCSCNSM